MEEGAGAGSGDTGVSKTLPLTKGEFFHLTVPVAGFSMMTTSWCCDECDVSLETEFEHRQGVAVSPGF